MAKMRTALVLGTVLAGLLAVAGCGGRSDEQSGSATQRGDDFRRMVWRFPAEMPHLNPITGSDYYATRVESFIFDSLLDRDPETFESLPYVAESWEISEDKLTYTFHLRQDAVYSDGQPLTAHDVKFTFDRIMDPAVDAAHMRNYYNDVTDCDVLDDYTIRFTCKQPYYRHLVMLGGIPIMPKHIYGEGDFNNHSNNRRPVGSGRYTLERWETGAQVVLRKNPKSWNLREEPLFDEILIKFITDDSSAFQVLNRGEIDVSSVLPEQWARQTTTPQFTQRFNKYAYFRPAYNYLGWNMRRPQFEDKRVRQALTMLLDRETIVETIYEGLATVATGNFLPGTDAYDASIAPWPFDPQAAVKLLDEAGWGDSTGNGVRDKDGVELRFSVMTTAQNPLAERILTVFKEELERNGIRMEIRQLEWASMIERVQALEFDAMIMGWSMPPDPDPYQVWHSSQTEEGSNYVNFNNPEADKLIEDARVTFDDDARNAMYRRFHQIVHEEQPYTFLTIPKSLLCVNKKIENVNIYPIGVDEREWYIP